MKRIRRSLLLTALALLLAPAIPAQDDDAGRPPAIDAEEAVRIALSNHPLLDASAAEIEAAEADKQTARSGYIPRIDLTEQFARSTNPVFVFASKLGQEAFTAADFDLDALNRPDAYTNSQFQVTLMQNIWDGGRTGQGNKAAAAGIDAARQSRLRTEDEIAFGAIRAFWMQVVSEEMLAVTRDAEEASRANVALASELVESGLAVRSDLMSAEVRLAEVQALAIRAEQGVQVARAALRQALGLDSLQTFRVIRPTDELPPPGDTLEQRQEDALATRPDLRALEQRKRQAAHGIKIANSPRLPQFGLIAQWEMNGEQLLGNDGDNWTVGLGIRYRLFDGTEHKARVRKAKAQDAQLDSMLEAMRQGIRLEVQAAWAERVSAERRLEVASAALERSAEALRIVRDRYGEGMAVMVELLAAEAAHTKTRADLVAAEGDVRLARAALDLASGHRGWKQAAPDHADDSLARLMPEAEHGDDDAIR